MPNRKLKTNAKAKDLMLAVLFASLILIGFVGVYVVAYYENGVVSESLFISNAETDFNSFEYDENCAYEGWSLRTSQKWNDPPSDYYQTNYTPVYQGNDTWAFSIDGFDSTATVGYVDICMDLPNMDDWVIEKIILNMTLPNEDDQHVGISIWTTNSIITYEDSPYSADIDQITPIYSSSHDSVSEFNLEIDVALTKALRVYDLAQEKTFYSVLFGVGDTDDDGIPSHAVQFKMEIIGQKTRAQTLNTQLTWILGGASVLNIVGIIYMTDSIDLGKTTIDLRPPKRRKGKR